MSLQKNTLLLIAILLACSTTAFAVPFTLTATANEIGATVLGFDPACPSFTANPNCVPNANLQTVPFTVADGFNFTSDPKYKSVYLIQSIQVTFSMTGVNTASGDYFNLLRLWFNGNGTGLSINGFDATHQQLTFFVGPNNAAFPGIANAIRNTGALTGQIRNVFNVPADINFPGTASISIVADVPEPSTMVLFGIGLTFAGATRLRRR